MDGGCTIISVRTTRYGVEATANVASEGFRSLIPLDQQTQSFADKLVGCCIQSRGNLIVHDLF